MLGEAKPWPALLQLASEREAVGRERMALLGLLLLTLSSDQPVDFLQHKLAQKYKSYVLALKTTLRSNLQELSRH